ncbi:MAG: anthranilate synthase component I family protein [Pseudomonadota bacterium]
MITMEIPWRSPEAGFAPFAGGRPFAALLRTGARAADAGWAILAHAPRRTLELRDGVAFIDGESAAGRPFDVARGWLEALAASAADEIAAEDAALTPPFRRGLLGFIGYEAAREFEPTLDLPASPYALPDLALGLYECSAAFHLPTRRAFVSAPDQSAARRIAASLGTVEPPARLNTDEQARLCTSTIDGGRYQSMVAEAVERIRDGAFYQANLAHRPEFDLTARPFDLFRAVASRTDASFPAFLQYKEGIILSASPERFFNVRRDEGVLRIAAEPIKGTRPRGWTKEEDARLATELLNDPKDRAENVMIADLMRNDLSRVCADGSVREEHICRLVSYRTVHHLVSRISGRLRSGLSALEAMAALFPCGSITGAPKVAAMRTIGEFEGEGRGPYCGAIGYFDASGAADFSVAIRTAIIEPGDGSMSAPVGCGVTLRSSPEEEFEESLSKLQWLAPSDQKDERLRP